MQSHAPPKDAATKSTAQNAKATGAALPATSNRSDLNSSAQASPKLRPVWDFDGLRIFDDRAETPTGYFSPVGLPSRPLPIVDRNDQSEVEAERAGASAARAGGLPEGDSSVRIHTGPAAERLAAGLGARAVTVGSDIMFGQGEYAPHTSSGSALLAHELTHVSQQARTGPRVALERIDDFAPFESEGSRKAREFAAMTISIVEDVLLATLRRDGANAFILQLQRQTASDRALLGQSPSMLAAVRSTLGGYDLWNAETVLGVRTAAKQSLERPAPATIDPFLTPAQQQAANDAERADEDIRRLAFSLVRDPLVEALRRRSAIDFLRLLRALSEPHRRLLETDSTFFAELRRHYRGTSLFLVRRTLRFGSNFANVPEPVRDLTRSVRRKNATQVQDLLRAFPDLRSEQVTPGVRELIEHEFKRSPDLADMRRVLADGETHRQRVSQRTTHAHLKEPPGGGAMQLTRFSSRRRFTLTRTASEIRVIIRMRLVHTTVAGTNVTKTNRTFHLAETKRNEWRRQIETAWNGRFRAVSGVARPAIVFVPVFTDTDPHYTVGIVDRNQYIRSSTTTWWLHNEPSHKLIAHEFGHMFGAPDEYNLAGSLAEIPSSMRIGAADRRRTTVEGITGTAKSPKVGGHDMPGIMGSQGAEGAAGLPRHLWLVLEQINQQVRRATEAPFTITNQ